MRSRVLAGTSGPTTPRRARRRSELAGRLLGSAKDRHEHALAVESLADALRPLCTGLDVPATPEVITLRNVSHLSSDVTGTLDPGAPASLLQLADAVHPTAAVGGTPREAAVELIAELEGMDRGRYAGPVGWVDGDGDGELGIALRCAQLDGPVARLFAGCGVVADSDPDTEVREAAAKMLAVRDALEGGPAEPRPSALGARSTSRERHFRAIGLPERAVRAGRDRQAGGGGRGAGSGGRGGAVRRRGSAALVPADQRGDLQLGADLQLGQDRADLRAHGRDRHHELLGDQRRPAAGDDPADHLALPRGEPLPALPLLPHDRPAVRATASSRACSAALSRG